MSYLSVTLPGGRTEQISLPADLVPTAKEWVRNYKALWKAIEKVSAVNRQLLRQRRSTSGSAGRQKRKRRRS